MKTLPTLFVTALVFALAACSQQSAPEASVRTLAVFDLSNDTCDAHNLYNAFAEANDNGEADILLNGTCTYVLTGSELFVRGGSDVTVQGNGATIDADGRSRVFYNDGTLSLDALTVTGGVSVFGAGIYNEATLSLSNSTVSGNSAEFAGGIANVGGTLTLSNSTVSGNSAAVFGGGIFNNGTPSLSNSTVSGNSAEFGGGGIYQFSGPFTLSNSVIAYNAGGDCFRDSGAIIDQGYNLVGDGACISAPSSLSGDPLLGELTDNGGPTRTRLLLEGSPLVDAIPSGVNGCGTTLSTDQRGVTRPQGAACDIGAVEVEVTDPAALLDVLIAEVKGLRLAKNTDKSLVSLLENAKKSLEKGDTAGATDKLMSFVSQVEAQSGKKIDAGDAGALIAQAQAILDAID